MYRKPTHTDRLLDQSSYNPTSHKATTIRTLTRRAQLVCDSPDSLTDKNNSYLTNRYQFVYINGILSEQDLIKCGVPQGSILGPLLFLIYINDLSNITDFATTRMYADDTNMTFTACSVEGLRHEMNADIEKLKQWLCANKLTLNILKTEYMLIGSRQRTATVTESLDLSINGISLKKS